ELTADLSAKLGRTHRTAPQLGEYPRAQRISKCLRQAPVERLSPIPSLQVVRAVLDALGPALDRTRTDKGRQTCRDRHAPGSSRCGKPSRRLCLKRREPLQRLGETVNQFTPAARVKRQRFPGN